MLSGSEQVCDGFIPAEVAWNLVDDFESRHCLEIRKDSDL